MSVNGVKMNKDEFVKSIANELNALKLSHIESRKVAESILMGFLLCEEIKFGDAEYEWDKSLAVSLAIDEMQYWHED